MVGKVKEQEGKRKPGSKGARLLQVHAGPLPPAAPGFDLCVLQEALESQRWEELQDNLVFPTSHS